MSSATNYTESAILNSVFGKTSDFGALASAPTLYVGLSTSDPGEAGSLTGEPTIGSAGYARKATSASDWTASSGGSAIENAGTLAFPESSGAWAAGASLTHFFLADAASAGNVLFKASLTTARTVSATGVTLSFAAGALTCAAD